MYSVFKLKKIKYVFLFLSVTAAFSIVAILRCNFDKKYFKTDSRNEATDFGFKEEKLIGYIQNVMSCNPQCSRIELNDDDKVFLGENIKSLISKNNYSTEELRKIMLLLYAKNDISKYDYISESDRNLLINNIINYAPTNIIDKRLQIYLFKYSLGINNVNELEKYINKDASVCNTKFLDEINWSSYNTINSYFDIKNFCLVENDSTDKKRLLEFIRSSKDSRISHLKEHGIIDVPVYVNGCSKAKDKNEKYHCLFFIEN
jgi:hypothetical protein